jgi:predicted transcriptional regulator
MQAISLKLPDDLLEELEREARTRQVTKSVLVRESLEAALRGRPRRRAGSCYDLARDLAGAVKGLPRDLAHNPKYMDGFGE